MQITFAHKQLTAWGEACAGVAKFLERIRFREWVLGHVFVEEHSPNAKGIYEKVLALLLTSLTGGTRFSHVTGWGHGLEGLKACFGVAWLPQATSVLTWFFGKFRQRHNEGLRAAAVALSTWKKARRWVVIRQHVPTRPKASGREPMPFRELEEHREYRYSVLVTHDTALAPEEIGCT